MAYIKLLKLLLIPRPRHQAKQVLNQHSPAMAHQYMTLWKLLLTIGVRLERSAAGAMMHQRPQEGIHQAGTPASPPSAPLGISTAKSIKRSTRIRRVKRDKHDHNAVDRPEDKSEQSGPVSASVAAAETGVRADMTDDLQALRQAALQTNSVAGVDTVADGASQPAAAEGEFVPPEPMETV